MTVSVPTALYPVSPSYVQVGREGTSGVVAGAFQSLKSAVFKPNNKPTWLKEDAMWGDMNKVHDLQQGPIWSENEIPDSPLYGDTFGHFALGFFGDYYSSGTASTPTWTTSGPLSAGAVAIPVTSATAATAGTFVQIDSGVNSEVVTVGTGSTSTNIVVSALTPLRFNHLTTIAVVAVIAPFTHNFATLNPNSSTGLYNCQSPSHSIVHHNYIAGSGSYQSDLFLYSVMSELTLNWKANGWTTWSSKFTSFSQSAPGAAITASLSTVKGIPAWKSTTSVAGSLTNLVSAGSATWTREMDVIPTADGVQNPYVIGQGQIDSKFKLTITPAADESYLNYMLQNTQPSLAWLVSNGGSGSSLVSLGINAELAGFEQTPLTASKTFWGYECDGEFVASPTFAGNSGGNTLSQLVLINAIPTY